MGKRLTNDEMSKIWKISEEENRIWNLRYLAESIERIIEQGYAKYSDGHIMSVYEELNRLNRRQDNIEVKARTLGTDRSCFFIRNADAITKIRDQHEKFAATCLKPIDVSHPRNKCAKQCKPSRTSHAP